MTIATGTKLGRYEIRSQLGAGGMGEVYLAQDTKLHRNVAIKVLPADVASNEERVRRFVHEANAASALNHPNIITIYEIERADSVYFIATEFIEGETLRDRMRTRTMRLGEVLEISVQIANALSAAHAAGIVHRDIKPENVMVRSDGIVKVLDFGLAKLTGPDRPDLVDPEAPTRAAVNTSAGVVMGTASYMSPEQARSLPLDGRTDIFSLGTLMYQMLAGRLPFDGSTANEIIASILSDNEVPQLARYGVAVPAELERIVTKTLRKHRDERYQTARDLLNDLKSLQQDLEFKAKLERSVPAAGRGATEQLASGQTATKEQTQTQATSPDSVVTSIARNKVIAIVSALLLLAAIASLVLYLRERRAQGAIESIVVLPFENQNNDAATDYLSDGLTESIINSLTQLPNLKVIARSSAFHYKGKNADPFAAARELNVGAVLTGRVMQRGDNLAISTELLDVRDNKQLWGQQYNRKLADLVSLQRDIASDITSNLKLRLTSAEVNRATKNYTNDTEAYQLYLKGRFFIDKRTEQDLRKAIDYFGQAIAKDPNNALAYTGLSDAYTALVFPLGAVAPNESMPKAKEAALQALAIDNTLGEAHNSLAHETFFYEWNWPAAEREFKRALELNPNSADTHHGYSHFLIAQNRFDESLAESKRALELSPVDLVINIHLGWHYLYTRQYDLASEQINKVIEMDRNFAQAYTWIGLLYEQQRKYPEAIAAFQNAKRLFPGGSTVADAQLAHTYAVSGNRSEALKILAELQEKARSKYVSSYQIARIYAGLGDKDQVFNWLEKAYSERSEWMVMLTREQAFDELRSDPRYVSFVRRMGLPQ
ncbi:MAG TPA: protein kinase [Pyrinomonadaceae bacterium]